MTPDEYGLQTKHQGCWAHDGESQTATIGRLRAALEREVRNHHRRAGEWFCGCGCRVVWSTGKGTRQEQHAEHVDQAVAAALKGTQP